MGFYQNGFQTERKDRGLQNKFYGKYRAEVTNNADKDPVTGRMGRIKVKCPRIYGEDESDWCTPCLPYAGPNKGTMILPSVGDFVWIEFEEGDINSPIWVGSWWANGEILDEVDASYGKSEEGQHHQIKTGKVDIYFDDKDGNLNIKVDGDKPVSILMNAKAGTITLNGFTSSSTIS